MAIINSASALSQFDDLVTRGELFYTPSTPIILNDSGLDVRTTPSSPSLFSRPQVTKWPYPITNPI